MALIVVWLGLAILTAVAANARGRNWFVWLLLGVLFGVFALIAVLVMDRGDHVGGTSASIGPGGPMSKLGPSGPVVANHKGVLIYQHHALYWAMGVTFASINEAKSYIEANVS